MERTGDWREVLKHAAEAYESLERELQEQRANFDLERRAREDVFGELRAIDRMILEAALQVEDSLAVKGVAEKVIACLRKYEGSLVISASVWQLADDGLLTFIAGEPDVWEGRKSVEVENSLMATAVLTKREDPIKDLGDAKYAEYREELGAEVKSAIIVPVMRGHDVQGVVVAGFGAVDGFGETERDLTKLVAGQFAIAVQYTGWYEKFFEVLDVVGGFFSEDIEESVALKPILGMAMDLAGARFGQILVLDGDGEKLRIVCTSGEERVGLEVRVDDSVSGLAVSRSRVVVVNDRDAEDEAKRLYKSYLGSLMKSEIVAPMMIGSTMIGVINLEDPDRGKFKEEDVQARLKGFARQAAVAVRTARSLAELRSHEARQEAEYELAVLGSVVGNAVHSLNTDVGALSYWVSQIREECGEVLAGNPRLDELVGRVGRSVEKLGVLPARLKEHFQAPVREKLNVNDLVQAAVGRVPLPERIELDIRLDPDAPSMITSRSITWVVENLVANAVKALNEDGRIQVTTKYDEDDQARLSRWFIIGVEDDGPGVEPQEREAIFEPSKSTEGGLGFGLWWSRKYLTLVDGAIECVKPTSLKGARFEVRLPVGPEGESECPYGAE